MENHYLPLTHLNGMSLYRNNKVNDMGFLKCGKIDLNDRNIVENLINAVNQLVQTPSFYHSLRFKPQYYFETVGAS